MIHPDTAAGAMRLDATDDSLTGSDRPASRVVTALFDSRTSAEDAVAELTLAGIPESSISVVYGAESDASSSSTYSDETASGEPRGFFEMLGDFFFPDEDRDTYAEGLNRGGHLVTVRGLDGDHYDLALDILDDEGAVNLDERTESWRSEGWSTGQSTGGLTSGATQTDDDSMLRTSGLGTGGLGTGGYDPMEERLDAGYTGSATSGRDDDTIKVVEERLRVGKRDTRRGSVRVRSYVVEEPVSETVNLREQSVEIERHPVDRNLTDAEGAFTDKVIEAEEYREEVVASKEARVVEEIGIRTREDQRQETITDTVRHTEVEIDDDRDDSIPGGTTRR